MFSRHELKKWKEKSRTDLGYLTVRKTGSGEINRFPAGAGVPDGTLREWRHS